MARRKRKTNQHIVEDTLTQEDTVKKGTVRCSCGLSVEIKNHLKRAYDELARLHQEDAKAPEPAPEPEPEEPETPLDETWKNEDEDSN